MHTSLILFSLLIALLGSLGHLLLLRLVRSWDSRRIVQLAGLALPAVVLALLAAVMLHFVFQICFSTAPQADIALTTVVCGAGLVYIGAVLVTNRLRAALLAWHLRRYTWDGPTWLRQQVAERSACLGLQPPRLRVCADAYPRALVAGLFRPYLVVSSGLVGLLDQEELAAVIEHELIHLRRRDLWWSAWATVLHDLTWFLPATRRLLRLLRTEQELACDDQVLGEARRLALASALALVWQHTSGSHAAPRGVLTLLPSSRPEQFQARVTRLLDHTDAVAPTRTAQTLLTAGVLLGLVVLLQLRATLWTMSVLNCDTDLGWLSRVLAH